MPILLIAFDAILKFTPGAVDEGFAILGWPLRFAPLLGIIELGSVVVYLIPRTAVFGAILVVGYLGGATAAQLRIGDPFAFAPFIVRMLGWLGLWLPEPSLKQLLPLRSQIRKASGS